MVVCSEKGDELVERILGASEEQQTRSLVSEPEKSGRSGSSERLLAHLLVGNALDSNAIRARSGSHSDEVGESNI
ncbi:unnamed protein product [Gongylonema pulchrum]|uniref:Uncharacterized protein n=1 Tax=Gongylonema pulchrum TaxID=637853 RepID=A0A183DS84_9BILA|nr:unnamed protein product [Gongylonema pulchrum]